mmetsp:Transcript_27732/g.88022  ORF Transcript_27732/g.88022 Transcript_27732/m.88022 type:complete len:284 (-) Transcript_27732:988-1839(-)
MHLFAAVALLSAAPLASGFWAAAPKRARPRLAATRLAVTPAHPVDDDGAQNPVAKPIGPEDTVRFFGANLDADLAGPAAAHMPEVIAAAAAGDIDLTSDDGVATVYFAEGVGAMKKGQYDSAVALFRRATEFAGGHRTRRGGQMQLWLAQALHAARLTEDAHASLRTLEREGHASVRRAAKSLLLVLHAPTLKGVGERTNFPRARLEDLPNPLQQALKVEKVVKATGRTTYRPAARNWKPEPRPPRPPRRLEGALSEREETLAVVMPAIFFCSMSLLYVAFVL